MKKLLAKVKNSKLRKYMVSTMVASMVAVMGCMSCFAADGDTATIASELSSAFSSVANQLTNYAIIAIPSAAVVFALFFGVKKIFAFFKSIAK